MRFIIISTFFLIAVACVSSSPVEEPLKKVFVGVESPKESSYAKSFEKPVAVKNVASNYVCTLDSCAGLCGLFLNPPYWAWCYQNTCYCQKA